MQKIELTKQEKNLITLLTSMLETLLLPIPVILIHPFKIFYQSYKNIEEQRSVITDSLSAEYSELSKSQIEKIVDISIGFVLFKHKAFLFIQTCFELLFVLIILLKLYGV